MECPLMSSLSAKQVLSNLCFTMPTAIYTGVPSFSLLMDNYWWFFSKQKIMVEIILFLLKVTAGWLLLQEADLAEMSHSLSEPSSILPPGISNPADQRFSKIFWMRKVFAKEISRLTVFLQRILLKIHAMRRFLRGNPESRYSVQCIVDGWISRWWWELLGGFVDVQ